LWWAIEEYLLWLLFRGRIMQDEYWYVLGGAFTMYLLGVIMYLTVLEAEEEDVYGPFLVSLMWPYIAVRVALDKIMYGDKQ